MIQEKKVNSIDELSSELNGLSNSFMFRGHTDASWTLASTLERALGKKWSAKKARLAEDYFLREFQTKYHIYSGMEHTPATKLTWLSVMQHYGVPTRLIDFTTSPYVALYFALENFEVFQPTDLAIYAINYSQVLDASIDLIKDADADFKGNRRDIFLKNMQDDIFKDLIDPRSYNIAWITEPARLNVRIDRQAGTFLISGNREKTISEILFQNTYKECEMYKYIIKANLYDDLFRLVRRMNINSATMYGDLAGLGKSIKMQATFYSDSVWGSE